MAGLTAIIVSYNSEEFLPECIRAAKAWANPVIVIDNGSQDHSVQAAHECDGVTVIANKENRGFAGAVNQGLRLTMQPVALILNPDTHVEFEIDRLAEAATAPGYGAATGLLAGDDGSLQSGFNIRRLPSPAALAFEALGLNRLWPSNPINYRWRCLDFDVTQAQDVEQPAGAFLAIRREAWEAIGGFDENFHPIWFEDVDFCKRLTAAGWRIRFVPEARARHSGAHSIRQMAWVERQVQWYVSLLGYAAKHYKGFGRATVALSVAISSVPRVVLGFLQRRTFESFTVCGRVIELSFRCVTGRTPTKSNDRMKAVHER